MITKRVNSFFWSFTVISALITIKNWIIFLKLICFRWHHKNKANNSTLQESHVIWYHAKINIQNLVPDSAVLICTVSNNNTCIIMRFPFHTLVMGPVAELGDLVLQEADELPEWELPLGLLETNGLMDWLTPCARMNCSRSSTFVRPLAERIKTSHGLFHSTSNKSEVNYEKKFRKTRTSTEST